MSVFSNKVNVDITSELSVSITVTAAEQNPYRRSGWILKATGDPSYPPGTALTFTANVTGGVSPYSYSWNFGDGTSGTSNPVTHTYNTPGYYTVSVTVTDSIGETASASVTINIEVVPVLTLTITGVKTYNGSMYAVVGNTITLTAQLTYNNLGLENQEIDFYVNGTEVGHGLTDASGTVQVGVQVTSAGTLEIYAEYPGASGYQSVTTQTQTVYAVEPLSISSITVS